MLSVLVPTLPDRRPLLSRLLHSVLEQPGVNETFEVLVYQGPGLLGDKINRMVAEAAGTHVVVFDDDDWIAANYMTKVLPFLDHDSVGYKIGVLVDGRYEMTVTHSAQYRTWDGAKTERGFSHKTPIRRDIAAKVPFGNDYFDDKRWAAAVAPGINNWAFVDDILYWYDYQPVRDVGRWPHDPSQVRWL